MRRRTAVVALAATLASAGCVTTRAKVAGVTVGAAGVGMIALAADDDSGDFSTIGYVIGATLIVGSIIGLVLGHEMKDMFKRSDPD